MASKNLPLILVICISIVFCIGQCNPEKENDEMTFLNSNKVYSENTKNNARSQTDAAHKISENEKNAMLYEQIYSKYFKNFYEHLNSLKARGMMTLDYNKKYAPERRFPDEQEHVHISLPLHFQKHGASDPPLPDFMIPKTLLLAINPNKTVNIVYVVLPFSCPGNTNSSNSQRASLEAHCSNLIHSKRYKRYIYEGSKLVPQKKTPNLQHSDSFNILTDPNTLLTITNKNSFKGIWSDLFGEENLDFPVTLDSQTAVLLDRILKSKLVQSISDSYFRERSSYEPENPLIAIILINPEENEILSSKSMLNMVSREVSPCMFLKEPMLNQTISNTKWPLMIKEIMNRDNMTKDHILKIVARNSMENQHGGGRRSCCCLYPVLINNFLS